MRSKNPAAVDTMGAEALAAHGDAPPDSSEFRFQTLVATMLSPQTKDKQTHTAYTNLIKLVHPLPFLPVNFIQYNVETIQKQISAVSFAKTKAQNIYDAAVTCVNSYNNDIPTHIEDLFKFKGVGPKIAYLTFSIAYNQSLGICVDTHVHRIANRLGWVGNDSIYNEQGQFINMSGGDETSSIDTTQANTQNTATNKQTSAKVKKTSTFATSKVSKGTSSPEKTRIELQKLLPQEYWNEVNGLLVGFGQTICSARAPKCHQCLLTRTCKYYAANAEAN